MPKRSIESFRPTDRWVCDDPFYTKEQIDEIIQKAPVSVPDGDLRAALTERLESAARAHQVLNEWQAAPTKKQLADRYRQIEDRAKALLEALGVLSGEVVEVDKMPDGLLIGKPPPREAVQGVERLRCWAQDRVAWAEARPATPRHGSDEALDELVCCMVSIWLDVFARQPGRSVTQETWRHGGPFARFVQAALLPLRGSDTPTEGQIADRLKKLQDMGKLP
jgi:hypothetical protein